MAPRGLSKNQEAFIEAYLETGNASEAYRRSYKCTSFKASTINAEATRLKNHPLIAPRLKLIKEAACVAQLITLESILEELEEARGIAKACNQGAPMINASMGKAKLLGLIVDKSQVAVTQKFEELDDEELDDYIDERLR